MGPLVAGGLVLVEEPDRPFLTRSLRVPDRVTAHLLGDDRRSRSGRACASMPAAVARRARRRSTRALRDGMPLVYLREPSAGVGEAMAAEPLAPSAARRWRSTSRA